MCAESHKRAYKLSAAAMDSTHGDDDDDDNDDDDVGVDGGGGGVPGSADAWAAAVAQDVVQIRAEIARVRSFLATDPRAVALFERGEEVVPKTRLAKCADSVHGSMF